jgi:alginate O-acetyltransferase complex protein AlgI
MLFNSLPFLVFFLCFYLVYRLLNHKQQNYLLFWGGLFFYSYADYRVTPILLFTIVFNFYLGIAIFNNLNTIKAKHFLYFGLFINISILAFFKYFLFSLKIMDDLGLWRGDYPSIVLPLGISFYTFHNVSYIFDIYKKKIEPTTNLLIYSIYDMFFPLLLAGPIERAEKLIPQIESTRNPNLNLIFSGVFLFIFGLLKKKVLADQYAELVDIALVSERPSGFSLWLAFTMGIQVYADFSGYSDMARGLARILGFELSLNFFHPYFAKNPIEFWKRWHISLSTWLKDYVYIPLGGNRDGLMRQNANLVLVWFSCGLWHGAGYGYIIWGFYCGIQVIIYHNIIKFIESTKIKHGYLTFIGSFLTYLIRIFEYPLISVPFMILSFGLGLLLFKISNLNEFSLILWDLKPGYWNEIFFFKLLLYLFPVVLIEFYQIKTKDEELKEFSKKPITFGLGFLLVIIYLSLFGISESKEFFYFQF